MDPDQKTIQELAAKYLNGTATEAEKAQLHAWYDAVPEGDAEVVLTEEEVSVAAYGELMLAEIRDHISASQVSEGQAAEHQEAVVRRISWRRWAAAAILILAMGSGAWWFSNGKRAADMPQAARSRFGDDVTAPQVQKAILTLADGSVIQLDSTGRGTLAQQGSMQISRQDDGAIGYTSTGGQQETATGINTLYVPYGSKPLTLALSDGSRVWIDAGSTLTYPAAFTAAERRVKINGQAYFEVAHNPASPFIVEKVDLAIRVLGTHFNVNAFDDETDSRITLLEGAVNVSRGEQAIRLKPGQQASVAAKITMQEDVDLDAVMAWKNGRFELNGSTIGPIMRQVARWYDVNVEFQGALPADNFVGSISRQENVSEVLKILEHTQVVQFKIEGKKITVMKK
ncbi:FecR family protein [Flavihumibacter petaseus]|uniref:Putative anti-sigma factor n=1 Tax=Flavihumibacter petaseus NBRC 106054 TaxID=1220578 RepID=A0A0E9N0B9_9BACT|nr:FecR family protein [Flavihumibacter petaseus]GAO43071.1 putative anti-sigma factor [Flavihumibacter petaseus NBRC 106054]